MRKRKIFRLYFAFPILMVTLLSFSCNPGQKDFSSIKVEYKGALKNMMQSGDISAKASLSQFMEKEHVYAIGAMENLKGEIQIFDSQAFNVSMIDGELKFDHTFSKKATLLVYATVQKWESYNIPGTIKTDEQIEAFVAKTAKEHQIPADIPFPFLIKGQVDSLNWHVIDWKKGDMEHSHEKHKASGLQGMINDKEVEILGFYSNAHHAIFTHHTTNMHLHVRTLDNTIAGHVDDLVLNEKMELLLPKTGSLK